MTVNAQTIRRTNRLLTAGTWFLIGGVVFYSLMTTTPFVREHTAPGWEDSAPLLGLMVDVAFVMALQADSVLAQLGVDGGPWPVAFRWFTGAASVFLNTWHSISTNDPVGVAVHLIAPALLLIVAEVGPVYRRRMAEALAAAEAPAATVVNTPAPAEVDVRRDTPSVVPQQVTAAPEFEQLPASANPLVICGGHEVFTPAVPTREVDSGEDAEDEPEDGRLTATEALNRIRVSWVTGDSITEAARKSTRSRSYVHKVYARLDAARGVQPESEITVPAAA